ncbi:MAG: patatin-like phospholipase family protein [Synergistaceae bacterium]|jgi:NTE family protein|nr:patatin-like phospholipase family protein [Synergistaceae bacterium]
MKRFVCVMVFVAISMTAAVRSVAAPLPAGNGTRGGVVLVLSGGGTKGLAHIGVLKVLERERIPIVGIVGVSMGSIIGGLYACGYSADEIRDIVDDTNIMGLIADSGTRVKIDAGIHKPIGEMAQLYHLDFDKDFKLSGPLGMLPALSLAHFLSKYTGYLQTADFGDLPIPFACVATDLETGEKVVLRKGNLASSIRASSSIPGLLEPWPVDGKLLVDGGLVDNVPVGVAKEIFPGYPVIAVNLAGSSIAKPKERFKSVVDVMMQTIDIMTIDRIKSNEAMADLMLYPDVGMYGILGSSDYDEIYSKGVEAAEAGLERISALSAAAPEAPERNIPAAAMVVNTVKVEGLHEGLASDIEKIYSFWKGKPYDADAVNGALERIARLDEVAAVDVDVLPSQNGNSSGVDVVFSVARRPAFGIGADGYTSSLHPHRWVAVMMNARDLSAMGDATNMTVRLGNDEWSGDAEYFTPLSGGGQWGFALSGGREKYDLKNFEEYTLGRYSARVMHYSDKMKNYRLGIGIGGEYADTHGYHRFVWGPYLYFNRDTLDNLLTPSRGYSLNLRFWFNNDNIPVSRTTLNAYVPLRSNLRFLLNFGLETGENDNPAYRVLLGDREEMLSLARHPWAGDQAAWASVGIGRDLRHSWWGSLRGDIFATYGSVLENWEVTHDSWEAGIALTVSGQILRGRIAVVYSSEDEFVFGFSIGDPMWHSSPMP